MRWAAPYASSLLARSRARARCELGAFVSHGLPPPTCSRPVSGVGLGLFVTRLPCCSLPAPALPLFRSAICDCVNKRMVVSRKGEQSLAVGARRVGACRYSAAPRPLRGRIGRWALRQESTTLGHCGATDSTTMQKTHTSEFNNLSVKVYCTGPAARGRQRQRARVRGGQKGPSRRARASRCAGQSAPRLSARAVRALRARARARRSADVQPRGRMSARARLRRARLKADPAPPLLQDPAPPLLLQ